MAKPKDIILTGAEAGDLLTLKGGYGSRQKLPLVPPSDGAGVVEAVGADVRTFAPGDRAVGRFFENWRDGELSEAKMHAALEGYVASGAHFGKVAKASQERV